MCDASFSAELGYFEVNAAVLQVYVTMAIEVNVGNEAPIAPSTLGSFTCDHSERIITVSSTKV